MDVQQDFKCTVILQSFGVALSMDENTTGYVCVRESMLLVGVGISSIKIITGIK